MRFLIPLFMLSGLLWSLSAFSMDFKTGDNLEVQGEYSDNLFAAGGQIHAQLRSTDDVFMVGWSIRLQDSSLRDLIAAGGSLRLVKVEVQDDLVLAGEKVSVDEGSSVKGSTLIMGENVTLAGHFLGEVRVMAENLKLSPSLVIEGNLIHKTESLEVSDGARIMGQTIAEHVNEKEWVEGGLALGFFGVLFLLGGLLVIPLLAVAFPKVADQGASILRNHFWECLGKGIVAAIIVMVAWFVLMVSVIGAPIALVSLPFIMVAKMLSWTIAVFTVGTLIRNRGRLESAPLSRKARFGWTLLGSLVLAVVMFIPFLGFLLILLLCFAGFGALYLEVKHWYDRKALN